MASKAATGAELSELARLQYMAGECDRGARHARACAARPAAGDPRTCSMAARFVMNTPLRCFMPASNSRAAATPDARQEILAQLDRMLANYEKNGGQHFGLYSLRAESLAMQGKTAEAQAALKTAWKRGWRTRWRAQGDPYLGQVRMPGD